MTTVHCWFRSGPYTLLGHMDCPQTTCGSLGVVIVPPFGWEDVCSYRPLRFLGGMFAAHGIPALRFDLPGTGDSSGGARDAGLLDAWIRSVGDAADQLRIAAGVENIAVLGIHMGAILAVVAASRHSNVQDLILWGGAASGRAILRELRAFASVARAEYSNGDAPPPQPVPGLEVGGFLLSPETQAALEALSLSALPGMQVRRALVLSRDDIRPDAKLVRALETSGCSVEVRTGVGYTAMMAGPEEALPPDATGSAIVEFLTDESQADLDQKLLAPQAVTASIPGYGSTLNETTFSAMSPPGPMFGVLSEPGPGEPRSDCCVLFLNPGAVRHTGPNRMWVETARRWAARGVVSLRLDLAGIGESGGQPNHNIASLYQDKLVDQVEIAMNSLRSRHGIRQFAAIGLCSGAFWAFHAAVRDRDIRAAILLNPRLFFWDPEIDRRRVLQRTAGLLTDDGDWRRLARGHVSLKTIKRVARTVFDSALSQRLFSGRQFQIDSSALARAWAALERNKSRVAMIFTEGEPLLREMEEEGHLPTETNPRIRCVRMANSGHTFRPLWAQQAVQDLIDREIEKVVGDCAGAGRLPEPFTISSQRQSAATSGSNDYQE